MTIATSIAIVERRLSMANPLHVLELALFTRYGLSAKHRPLQPMGMVCRLFVETTKQKGSSRELGRGMHTLPKRG